MVSDRTRELPTSFAFTHLPGLFTKYKNGILVERDLHADSKVTWHAMC